MAKWITFSLVALAFVGYLMAKPLDASETNHESLNNVDRTSVSLEAADLNNQPLKRQKRQYYYSNPSIHYWNALYTPYDYYNYNNKNKRKKYPNRRGYKSTTQRYTIWDLA